jgi:uracil-DNA glycosylase
VSTINWPNEFAKVIGCAGCSKTTDPNILRDAQENVPQPGYIGERYWQSRILLVGQNPGTPKTLEFQDRPYTVALRNLMNNPTDERYAELHSVLQRFIPEWPVSGNYFPLKESGLTFTDIAYLNLVRCRTDNDAKPRAQTVNTCLQSHFVRWLDNLSPKAVIFIGKWAADHAYQEVERRGIPFAFMNRQRSLSSERRIENRQSVVSLVRSVNFGNPV